MGKRYMQNSAVFNIRVEEDLKDVVLEHCRKEGRTLSGLIRKLLTEYAIKEGLINDDTQA